MLALEHRPRLAASSPHLRWTGLPVRHDWTQYTDVAAANPAKMREMTDLMFGEFAKYQVLPLDRRWQRDWWRRAQT
jgi:hypothetical protein